MQPVAASSLKLLFVNLTNDVGANRIVEEFGRRGADCGVLGGAGNYAAASSFAHRTFPLASGARAPFAAPMTRRALEQILATWRPDRIFAIDESGSHLLRHIAISPRASLELRQILTTSLGDLAFYATATCRAGLMELARSIGIRAPDFAVIGSWADAIVAGEQLGYPFFLKREYTCGGAGVRRIRHVAELRSAFAAGMLRATGKRIVARLGGHSPAASPPLMAQALVSGVVAFRAIACEKGETLTGVSFLCERQDPPDVGASTIVQQIDHAEMAASAAALVARLGCSGFAGFDYILDDQGRAHLIEMNARPIGTSHLGARFGFDLYGAYLARARGAPAPVAEPQFGPGERIAIFPREILRDPYSEAFDPGSEVFHDVPWGDAPALALHQVRIMARWPDQKARIEQILTPPNPTGQTIQPLKRQDSNAA